MNEGQIEEYEDPTIEDLALDITDYASVMRGDTAKRNIGRAD